MHYFVNLLIKTIHHDLQLRLIIVHMLPRSRSSAFSACVKWSPGWVSLPLRFCIGAFSLINTTHTNRPPRRPVGHDSSIPKHRQNKKLKELIIVFKYFRVYAREEWRRPGHSPRPSLLQQTSPPSLPYLPPLPSQEWPGSSASRGNKRVRRNSHA